MADGSGGAFHFSRAGGAGRSLASRRAERENVFFALAAVRAARRGSANFSMAKEKGRFFF